MAFVQAQELSGIVEHLLDMTLHLRDWSEAASLRYRNRAEITVLCLNRCPILYGFRAGTKAIRNRDWREAASLRYRNRAEITVLIREQMPYPVWFS